jgi:protein TonB
LQQEATSPALLATTAPSETTFVVVVVAAPPPAPSPQPALHAGAGTATAPAPAGQAPAAPAPLVEAHLDANYLDNPRPAYPGISRRLGETGTVRLRVHVGADGRTLEVVVQASSGHPRLDESAAAAVSRWRFVPARHGTLAVASWVIVPITYSLD